MVNPLVKGQPMGHIQGFSSPMSRSEFLGKSPGMRTLWPENHMIAPQLCRSAGLFRSIVASNWVSSVERGLLFAILFWISMKSGAKNLPLADGKHFSESATEGTSV